MVIELIMALFEDRVEAAEQLARRVQEWLDNNDKNIEVTRQKPKLEGWEPQNDNDEFIVLAIPRGCSYWRYRIKYASC
jgi:predicted phosphoribosyltransferase